ncbi:hypothetical protein BC830DRAFT_1159605, partial [Chytriomyces sp. MP71]
DPRVSHCRRALTRDARTTQLAWMRCRLHQRVQNRVHPLSLNPTSPGCISSSRNRNLHLQNKPWGKQPRMSYVAAMVAN